MKNGGIHFTPPPVEFFLEMQNDISYYPINTMGVIDLKNTKKCLLF